MKRHLIIYAKRPLPGYAKTRLGAVIGAEQAAGVYARLLYTYLLVLLRANPAETRIELSVASPADVPFFAEAFPELLVRPQVEGGLGQRMRASFEQTFVEGAKMAVLTGSDIPGLDAEIVHAAFDALESTPVVLGPSDDGGYYLIGMRAPGADLFRDIAWSTAHVLAQTEALAQAQELAITYLPKRNDIDVAADWKRWRQRLE